MLRNPFRIMNLRILGEVKDNRSWATTTSNIESSAYCPCHIFRATNLITPFGNRLSDAHQIDLLECISAQCSYTYLTGNNDNGRRVHHSVSHARKRISSTRTAGYDTHTHFTTYTCITLCCMCSSLFMTYKDMIERFFLASCIVIECIIYRHDSPSRVSEDGFHPFTLQGTHQCL